MFIRWTHIQHQLAQDREGNHQAGCGKLLTHSRLCAASYECGTAKPLVAWALHVLEALDSQTTVTANTFFNGM